MRPLLLLLVGEVVALVGVPVCLAYYVRYGSPWAYVGFMVSVAIGSVCVYTATERARRG